MYKKLTLMYKKTYQDNWREENVFTEYVLLKS